MRKLTYILLLIGLSVSAQKITQEGYSYATKQNGDTISRHTTYRKALEVSLNQVDGVYYIIQPRIRVEVEKGEVLPIPTTELEFISISTSNITSTSATVMVELSSQIFDYAYVKFKRDIDTVWQETSKGKTAIISENNLIPNSNYEYQVFASDNGIEINSMKLTFKTN